MRILLLCKWNYTGFPTKSNTAPVVSVKQTNKTTTKDMHTRFAPKNSTKLWQHKTLLQPLRQENSDVAAPLIKVDSSCTSRSQKKKMSLLDKGNEWLKTSIHKEQTKTAPFQKIIDPEAGRRGVIRTHTHEKEWHSPFPNLKSFSFRRYWHWFCILEWNSLKNWSLPQLRHVTRSLHYCGNSVYFQNRYTKTPRNFKCFSVICRVKSFSTIPEFRR